MTSPKQEGAFKRLVRSLSRSSPRSERPRLQQRSSSRGKRLDDIAKYAPTNNAVAIPNTLPSPQGASYSTSPPPDSYFPRPPSEVLHDSEANGQERHPDSIGARAFDVGESSKGMAAPGVTFAPAAPGAPTKVRPDSELDGWRPPPPRRTTSQRVRRQPSSSGKGEMNGTGGGLSGHRSGERRKGESISTAVELDGVPVPTLPSMQPVELNGGGEHVEIGDRALDAGERWGVTLEDRPLSRNASQGLKRTASQWKKAAQKAFDPLPKEEGEKRVIVLVADGAEEIEVFTAYDVFVRASLNPVLVSVSPQFSPSNSLPHITLSRGARILADTQFETLMEEHWDLFDAVVVPGGAKGAERLSGEKRVQELLWRFWSEQKLVGCICAGSLAALTSQIGLGGALTSHPSVRSQLEKHYDYSDDRVVVAGNLVTSRGPGTALEWALQVVEILAGRKKRDEVEGPMIA
ncbi:DJ-1 family protein [Rhodotorula toruloides]|uniref:D-lactate dehydratase n=1 Tax=Rhodotorula toruloides TaxID=5286 RepID=A0A511KAD1_RHOTO|nr:DJ-1 family protein [Rhodotorula toruloides]